MPNIERPFSDTNNWKTYCDPGHLYYFSKNSLKNLLYRTGLKPLCITDNIFEPYGNLFCIAKNIDKLFNSNNYELILDNHENIKMIWNDFILYHKWRFYKRKIVRLINKIFYYKTD